MTTNRLDQALTNYSKTAKSSSKKSVAKLVGYGAAAAGGLLTCNQAEADIIYSGAVNFTFTSAAYAFDMDGDGNNDFAFGVQSVPASDGTGGWAFFGQGTKGGFGVQGNGVGAYPGALQQSFSAGTVSAGNVATSGTGWMGWAAGGAATTDAWNAFANPGVSQTGYVGMQFNGSTEDGDTAGTMNGWVKLGIQFNDNDGSGTVNAGDTLDSTVFEWAFNNNPTDDFNGRRFGQTFDGTPGGIHIGAIPEPGSMSALALLSLGAVGVRRRKKIA